MADFFFPDLALSVNGNSTDLEILYLFFFFSQKNSKRCVVVLFFKEFLIQLSEYVVLQMSKVHNMCMCIYVKALHILAISKYSCRFLFCFMLTGEEEECSFILALSSSVTER